MTQTELEILLKDLQALPQECEWVEFKLNNYKPENIGEYLSALSNGACYKKQTFGYLVYGIEDVSHRLTGTTFKPHSTKIGNEQLENWLACHLNPRVDFNIFNFEFQGLNFVIFRIQRTSYIPVTFKGQSYIRIGSYKKKLSDHPEREKIIWNQEGSFSFEKEICMRDVSSDFILKVIDYPSFFNLLNLPLPDNKKGIIDKFIQEKIITNISGKYDITNLGAILFAKEISEFDELNRKALRVIFYDGKNKIKTSKEQLGKKGYAVGFEGLIKYLDDQLPSKEIIGKALREKVSEYPILAIREGCTTKCSFLKKVVSCE